jgi:hypothetical protein
MSRRDYEHGAALAREQIARTVDAGLSDASRAVVSACGAAMAKGIRECMVVISALPADQQMTAASLFIADIGELAKSLGETARRHGA